MRRGKVKADSGIGLDLLDVNIIRELQADARISYRALARKLGVSVTTVSGRVRRMKDTGLIRSFTIIVNPEKAGNVYCTALYIRTENGSDPRKVGEAVSGIKGICYTYHTLGIYNLIALGSAPNKDDFSSMIRQINGLKGVKEVIPSVVLDTIKEDPKHIIALAGR
ncbi:MAG: Lrp/AsnC family transcriptional regulator [Thermoplasmata archaeon]|uniref:Lrp/AsnC family transcriptional regulator n=1 Tax=Candidatus Sysuiplasma superficiale TaxID=2823368 RepID=A0A8J7YLN4_9ARCH|nr:Lrp/AsnC family transcriptional regulator [Candidatus Sysuiplasma superficiale]MCL4346523.1 Lrp/AsnC family transcriptional regulator [Candidatus Thermoplasmatota archaeon]